VARWVKFRLFPLTLIVVLTTLSQYRASVRSLIDVGSALRYAMQLEHSTATQIAFSPILKFCRAQSLHVTDDVVLTVAQLQLKNSAR